jgi:hypothetical protein
MNSVDDAQTRTGFCIYINTAFDGAIPAVRNDRGEAIVFATEWEAQREIAANMITRLQQFIDGERDSEDAFAKGEYIVEVDVLADGSVLDASGGRFW